MVDIFVERRSEPGRAKRKGMTRFCVVTLAILASSPAYSQEWNTLIDDRFGYAVPIPSEYTLSLRPEAGNSRLYHNARGDLLAVWAAKLHDRSFTNWVEDRRVQDEESGWDITYVRFTPNWASYSGVQGDQIRYVRAIRFCRDRTALFLIDYARSEKARYDPIITHMVRQMRPLAECRP
jgi:hypothetical protein